VHYLVGFDAMPAFGALLMLKLARLASANALVSDKASPVPAATRPWFRPRHLGFVQ
jgi:hypothetical protein